jgi:CheY-like chemotaxis protein
MRILAVDDNDAHRYALRKILEQAGHEVLDACNGAETIDTAVREIPQVILLDINLPDMNGYDVCDQIKKDARTGKCAVIFHSATDATAMARARAETVGASAFLTYPINREHLLSVVEGAAARSRR